MNIETALHRGYRAWSPSPQATNLDVWVDDHVPMVGTFEVEGSTVVFSAILEPTEAISVWVYAELTSDEAAFLDSHIFDDAHAIDDYVNQVFADRQVTYATTADFCVRHFSSTQLDGRSTVRGAIDFLKSVSDALTHMEPKDSPNRIGNSNREIEQVDWEAAKFKRLVSA